MNRKRRFIANGFVSIIRAGNKEQYNLAELYKEQLSGAINYMRYTEEISVDDYFRLNKLISLLNVKYLI